MEPDKRQDRIIFRCDDVTANTDLVNLELIYNYLLKKFPHLEFWKCVTLFSKTNGLGSVYPSPPFKKRPKRFFYDVDAYRDDFDLVGGKTVSHGLIHADHSKLQYDAQEMSIVTSCNYLNTDIFVPPFNFYNEATESICKRYNITMTRESDGWKCLDYEAFDPNHRHWYFHPWRFKYGQFVKSIESVSTNTL